ncbi:hypothetical protein [Jeotgalibacillus haloalkalitolerans]|uniref:Uncharacterized protein n=1 Tax=Jeotgalibacillus haloalkalitolerans TaxID=3104292 RepID=A0ABU5KI81_9BACL|nr:hypothetical protein [Jeotgalibacillus sp. HH7-29]MDZ5710944.1 hypothetical protein [Jeotgalibacillus sp. HH7-29]
MSNTSEPTRMDKLKSREKIFLGLLIGGALGLNFRLINVLMIDDITMQTVSNVELGIYILFFVVAVFGMLWVRKQKKIELEKNPEPEKKS